jgi:hypothetical protein
MQHAQPQCYARCLYPILQVFTRTLKNTGNTLIEIHQHKELISRQLNFFTEIDSSLEFQIPNWYISKSYNIFTYVSSFALCTVLHTWFIAKAVMELPGRASIMRVLCGGEQSRVGDCLSVFTIFSLPFKSARERALHVRPSGCERGLECTQCLAFLSLAKHGKAFFLTRVCYYFANTAGHCPEITRCTKNNNRVAHNYMCRVQRGCKRHVVRTWCVCSI